MPTSQQEAQLFQQSYRTGVPLLLYGLLWVGGMLAGFGWVGQLFGANGSLLANLLMAVLAAALAGGLGGATVLLSRLQRHIAVEQNFGHQPVLLYLVHPLVGVIAGILAMLLIALPCSLLINFAVNGQMLFAQSFTTSTFNALIILLAWCAAFYQQRGFEKAAARFSKSAPDAAPQLEPLPHFPVPIDAESPLSFKDWYQQQRQMRRWSFTWGIFIMGYGIVWLIGALLAYGWVGSSSSEEMAAATTTVAQLVFAAWPVAIAGVVGGVVGLFNDLYDHASNKQDFHRQHLMAYLVQPIIGLIFGWVIYFFIASGYLIINPETLPTLTDTPSLAMLQMVLGWAVGLRQYTINRLVLALIEDIAIFFKLVGKLLVPTTLFNQVERGKVLAEIKAHTRVFRPVAQDNSPTNISSWSTPLKRDKPS